MKRGLSKFVSSVIAWEFLFAMFLTVAIFAREPIRDFTLASATDQSEFTLSKARGKYVALHFLLKTECPVCLRYTHDYFERSAELPNVAQVFIKPDSQAEIAKWADKIEPKPAIYRDPNAQLAKKLKIPDGYKFHGESVHYPALVLLNTEGEEVFRYIGKNNGDRFSFDKLKEKISELSAAATKAR